MKKKHAQSSKENLATLSVTVFACHLSGHTPDEFQTSSTRYAGQEGINLKQSH